MLLNAARTALCSSQSMVPAYFLTRHVSWAMWLAYLSSAQKMQSNTGIGSLSLDELFCLGCLTWSFEDIGFLGLGDF